MDAKELDAQHMGLGHIRGIDLLWSKMDVHKKSIRSAMAIGRLEWSSIAILHRRLLS